MLVGCAHEYVAAAHYLSEGSNVYWPASQHTPVDFVLERGGSLLRVQVKTATRNRRRLTSTPIRGHRKGDPIPFDLLVVVGRGGLWEIPTSAISGQRCMLDTIHKEYRVK